VELNVRDHFPITNRKVRGRTLVYLDNAATTPKPKSVCAVIEHYNSVGTANVHRGVHWLSEEATASYEASRLGVQKFIGAKQKEEIVFTSGTTASINLVAHSWGGAFLKPDDEILLTEMEHHSNIVPWQMIAQKTGAKVKVVPVEDDGSIDIGRWGEAVSEKTAIASFVYISNSLGTINPVKKMIEAVRQRSNAVTLVDAAQAVAHMAIDVVDLDCDFMVFSGHKLYASSGVGVLYAKHNHLEAMPPFLGGGDMIRSVTFEKTIYAPPPFKFEAGTPPIAGVISLAPAIKFIESIGWDAIHKHEMDLLEYATESLTAIEGVRLIGTAPDKAAITAFVIKDIHPHDIGSLVDEQSVAIRTGHHCTQPIMQRFKVPATSRASMAMFNTKKEIDALVAAIINLKKIFGS
jgi:cysteine desulfurase / selenocysteine lyase